MQAIASKININNPDKWVTITASDIRKFGGDGLLEKYGNSVPQLLRALYPEYLIMLC
jgi:hypothetical protein